MIFSFGSCYGDVQTSRTAKSPDSQVEMQRHATLDDYEEDLTDDLNDSDGIDALSPEEKREAANNKMAIHLVMHGLGKLRSRSPSRSRWGSGFRRYVRRCYRRRSVRLSTRPRKIARRRPRHYRPRRPWRRFVIRCFGRRRQRVSKPRPPVLPPLLPETPPPTSPTPSPTTPTTEPPATTTQTVPRLTPRIGKRNERVRAWERLLEELAEE